MSMLTRLNPFRAPMQFDPWPHLDDLVRGFPSRSLNGVDGLPHMRIDVRESDGAYEVEMDLPGAERDGIEVTVAGNRVTVQAEFGKGRTEKNSKELYSERYIGRTFRSFDLPQAVDEGRCRATYEHGVLKLDLPHKEGGAEKRVPVQ